MSLQAITRRAADSLDAAVRAHRRRGARMGLAWARRNRAAAHDAAGERR